MVGGVADTDCSAPRRPGGAPGFVRRVVDRLEATGSSGANEPMRTTASGPQKTGGGQALAGAGFGVLPVFWSASVTQPPPIAL